MSSSIGSQTSGFKPPHIPSKSARQAAKRTINVVTKQQAPAAQNTKQAKPSPKVFDKQQLDKASQQKFHDQKQAVKTIKTKQAQVKDSFQNRQQIGKQRDSQLQEKFVGKKLQDKKLKREQSKQFAQKLSNARFGSIKKTKTTADQPQKLQNLHAQAMQARQGNLRLKSKAKKKKSPLESKLDKIKSYGGEKGKGFVAFVRREMTKGPLPAAIEELVDGFLKTLKGDSLTAAEMIADEKETIPLNTLRNMVSSANTDDIAAVKDSLSKSIANSAGERGDLLQVRNLHKPANRRQPPVPRLNPKKDKMESAIEFVSSINRGTLQAPWESSTLLAA